MVRKLWINNKLANINEKIKGFLTFLGIEYEWDNSGIVLEYGNFITSEDYYFITVDDENFVVLLSSSANVTQGVLNLANKGSTRGDVLVLVEGTVTDETLTL